MSLWSRIVNVFRGESLAREIAEEQESHILEAIAQGRDVREARRAFGSGLRQLETSRDLRLVAWLDWLRADIVFGGRQLTKRKITSTAAILSLALALGACLSAFRLIDALLLRPLPIAAPERLYELSRRQINFDGKPQTFDGWAYPSFARMRDAVKEQAELFAISYGERLDLTWGAAGETEKAHVQYVSGRMFGAFGLRPAAGRLFTEREDEHPGAHPVAVISDDYWASRFGRDSHAVGRTFRLAEQLFEVVGVAEQKFTGTEPGTLTDIFLPAMMKAEAVRNDATWHRTLLQLKPGVPVSAIEPLRQRLNAISLAFESERAQHFNGMPKVRRDNFLKQTVMLGPAPSGVSDLQNDYRRALFALGALVALVLLIACANVANLMTAQAAARAREMALRVSIGAGRWRLIQLVMAESALVASLAAALGGLFAWWSAPLVASLINPPDNPARLVLLPDWRTAVFGTSLIFLVTVLFGLTPALRASSVKPASALRGGEDPQARRRVMHALIGLQAAFCVVVLFLTGLFVSTLQRLSSQPTGFSANRLLALDAVVRPAQPRVFWSQVEARLRALPGVAKAGLAGWPLLAGIAANNFISVDGGPPSDVLAFNLNVSPQWREAMGIPLLSGRDLRADETGVALVNQAFARQYFEGRNPVGKSFEKTGSRQRFEIAGWVGDARYRSLRETTLPIAYLPFDGLPRKMTSATFMIRTAGSDALALAPALRQEIQSAGFGLRVSNVRTQLEINHAQTVRERLLATLAVFFGVVALVLAAVGLYGVLDYSVLQRRREIGIRIAIGARTTGIAQLVTRDVFSIVLAGASIGVATGLITVRSLESLFYQVQATDPAMLGLPAITLLGAALLAALPAVIRAVRIDPAVTLRAE